MSRPITASAWHIARELGLAAPELTLPVKKLLVETNSGSKDKCVPRNSIGLGGGSERTARDTSVARAEEL